MEKAIRKLLDKKPISGDDAGRIMILDLLAAFKDLSDGGEGRGVLSDEEKDVLVGGLTSPAEIQRFNDFRGIHDFLTDAGIVYESYFKTFEVYYLKLYHLLSDMTMAERENTRGHLTPVIMTEKQYEAFLLSGEPETLGGIAILRDSPEPGEAYIDENGFYHEPEQIWRRYMAENVLLEHSGFIQEALGGMKNMLAECFARRKALELTARFIKIPQVKILIPPFDEKRIVMLNGLMSSIIGNVNRFGDDGKSREIKLREELAALLRPIVPSEYEPEEKAVLKARRVLSFPFIKNNSEALVAMLKREWRDV